MSRHRRLRGSIATAALLAGVAVAVPASAGAAPRPTTSASASTITLDAAFRKALRADRLTLKAGKPATLKGTKLRLPVTGSTTAKGATTLTHGGSVTVRRGSRSTVLTSWRTVVQSRSATVSALIAKKRVTVLTISGGTVRSDAKTGKITISAGRVKLSSKGAKALRGRLKGSRLQAGTVGRVTTAATPKPATPAPGPATPVPAPASPTTPAVPTTPTPPVVPPVPLTCAPLAGTTFTDGARWAFKDSFLSDVQGPIAKGSVGCTAGATGLQAGGKVTSFQLTAPTDVDYDAGNGTTGTAVTRGITLDATFTGTIGFRGHDYGQGPLLDTTISNVHVELDGHGKGRIYADLTSRPFTATNVSAPPAPVESHSNVHLADLDVSGTPPTTDGGRRTWTGVPVTLSADGAAAFGGFYATGELLAPLTFAVPVTDACPALASTTFVDGAAWGVRASFRNYIQSPIAKGWITCGGGAAGHVTGGTVDLFRFDAPTGAQYNPGAGTLDATYEGRVRFRGHDSGKGPLLDLEFRNPRVVLDGPSTGRLYVDAVTRAFGGIDPTAAAPPREVHAGVHLADLNLTGVAPATAGGRTTWTAVPTTLTADGAHLAFADFYGAGEALDPITFAVDGSAP
ncbi:HtaA domain-containing protein [Patulibacter sp. NPDC049589]|uniref:HtaA domain-containing protein n=1 Tax=Patulibacter sp. NPDC049589 TaxID=3154731 RepID=UPI00343BB57C